MTPNKEEMKEWWSCCKNEAFESGFCLNCGTELDEHIPAIISLAIQKREGELREEIEKMKFEMAEKYGASIKQNIHDRETQHELKTERHGQLCAYDDVLILLTPPTGDKG